VGVHHGHGASGLDESRHVEIYLGLLEYLAATSASSRVHHPLRCACAEDAAARVAGVNRGLEGLACDVFNQLIHIARKIGDPVIERAVTSCWPTRSHTSAWARAG